MWQSRKYGNWQLAIDYKLLRGTLSALLNCCKNLPLGYYLAECKFCKFYILRLWNYVFYQPQNLTLSGRIIFFKSLKKVLTAHTKAYFRQILRVLQSSRQHQALQCFLSAWNRSPVKQKNSQFRYHTCYSFCCLRKAVIIPKKRDKMEYIRPEYHPPTRHISTPTPHMRV